MTATPRPGSCARWLGAVALATTPLAAHAHLVTTGIGPVYDGIGHFALTFEDLIPAVALALFAGLRGKEHARAVMVALPSAWLAGGCIGVLAGHTTILQLGWVSFALFGGLVATDLRVPRSVTVLLAVLLGGLLGHANGVAMSGGPGLRGILGVSAAVFVVTTLLTASVVAFQSGWRRIVWRVLGSWIAASGLLLLGWSLAR